MTATLHPGAVVTVTLPCPACRGEIAYTVRALHRWYGWRFAAKRSAQPCRCTLGVSAHAELRDIAAMRGKQAHGEALNDVEARWLAAWEARQPA